MNFLMLRICACVSSLAARQDGQDLVEYALVVALIAFGAIAGMGHLGGEIYVAFFDVSSDLASALN